VELTPVDVKLVVEDRKENYSARSKSWLSSKSF